MPVFMCNVQEKYIIIIYNYFIYLKFADIF